MATGGTLYDTIGVDYARLRRPDPRIAEQVRSALGKTRSVLNVGAGTGSYEPYDREVIALEPSAAMIAQRPAAAAAVVQGAAEALPFDDGTFDAVMAILTIHHWSDKRRGVEEMLRVSRGRVLILTFDPHSPLFWLADYVPALLTLDKAQMPTLSELEEWLSGDVRIEPVPIAHDCQDGFLAAYWRRPAAYLNERVRASMSSFRALGDVSGAMAELERDLKDGTFERRYADTLRGDTLDFGYRLVTAS